MKWSEAILKTMKLEDRFFFRVIMKEVAKKCGKKPAYMNTLINDEVAQHIFDHIDDSHFIVIVVPNDIEECES
jgi:hypothetical protein